jgi:hypothetical protein
MDSPLEYLLSFTLAVPMLVIALVLRLRYVSAFLSRLLLTLSLLGWSRFLRTRSARFCCTLTSVSHLIGMRTQAFTHSM